MTCWLQQNKNESFVNYYVEAQGPDFDREQLVSTALDLAGGGTDPGMTYIRWAIALLTNHVSVQERLHAEIDSVIGRQRLPTLDDQSRSVNKNSSMFLFQRLSVALQRGNAVSFLATFANSEV